jgi:hypothetical protein
MLTTNQKGLVAETAVIHECAKLGVPVARPLDDQRYDLIFDLGAKLCASNASGPREQEMSSRSERARAAAHDRA